MKKIKVMLFALFAAMACPQAADVQTTPSPASTDKRAPSGMKNVGVEEFEKLRSNKSTVVLDVRTPKEFAVGHIPGATNIDVNSPDFAKKVAGLDTNKVYLVHCAAGVRSAKACARMSQL